MFARSVLYAAVAAAGLTANDAMAVNLYVDNVYITQATQRYDRSVPLVADRSGLLRVFVLADQANTLRPDVLVHLYYTNASNQITLGKTITIKPHASMTGVLVGPTSAAKENNHVSNYQVVLSAADIKKTVRIYAEVDPTGVITQSSYTDDVYPRNARDANFNIVPANIAQQNVWNVPDFKANFVPIKVTPTNRTGVAVTSSNVESFIGWLRRVLPVKNSISWNAHATYTTNTTPASNYNGWGTILNELDALQVAEGNNRWHYYGVINPDYTSGGTGMAKIGGWAALGIQSSAGTKLQSDNGVDWRNGTFAHEVGHNLGLYHAPCGGAAGSDANYPYSGGKIGWPGYDVAGGKAYLPSDVDVTGNNWTDLMGYCGYDWISDYQYKRALNWRDSNDWPAAAGAVSAGSTGNGATQVVTIESVAASVEKQSASGMAVAVKPTPRPGEKEDCLLIWGRVENGVMTLEPAFEVYGVPDVDNPDGLYAVELQDAGAKNVRRLRFTPGEGSEGNLELFSLLVPKASFEAGTGKAGQIVDVDQIRIVDRVGAKQADLVSRSGNAKSFASGATPVLSRGAAGNVRLRWNAATHPVALVRDADTGEVLSFARHGDSEFDASAKRLDVQFSDGTRVLRSEMSVR